jgi:dihydrofolate reductase/thymidylate synthase
MKHQETQYTDMLRDVMENGNTRTGRNGIVKSTFAKTMTFDLTKGFPLLTTKKMFFRGIIEELLFFLRGDTDSTKLSDKKVRIWEPNTTREFLDKNGLDYTEGSMGPMYGYQWRHFNAQYENGTNTENGIDQLSEVINLIKTDPQSRRILMTSYNPNQAKLGVLFPCHSLILQFYVHGDRLDMYCYNRSQDLFLGTPFNIASSSLLLILIAKVCDKTPGNFTIAMGDTHIYESHFDNAKTQMSREPFQFPELDINLEDKSIKGIESMTYSDFTLKNYESHPKISATMIA